MAARRPILFNFMNNFYGMGGQPQGETLGFGMLARVGLGVNAAAMHSERVDGYHPLAVADATRRKKALLLAGQGPAMLDVITYRYSGHSPSDASSYRGRDEVEMWRQHDSIRGFGQYLCANGHADDETLESIQDSIVEKISRIVAAAIDLDASPRLTVVNDEIGAMMFSNGRADALDDRQPEVSQSIAESRFGVTSSKHRFGLDEQGNPLPKLKTLTYAEAIFEAMLQRFYQDPTMIAFGEENRDWGGAFGAYRGLTEAIPYHRLFNTPISEAAIVGTAVGYALAGGRAVPELMYCDFMGRAGDEIFNQMAKWQAMSANVLRMPVGAACFGRHEIRRAALAGLEFDSRADSRAESLLPRHGLRRQRHAQPGATPARILLFSSKASASMASRKFCFPVAYRSSITK